MVMGKTRRDRQCQNKAIQVSVEKGGVWGYDAV